MISSIPHHNITFTGDRFAGKFYMKQAATQLDILRKDMADRRQEVGRRVVNLTPTVTIEARSSFGNDTVNIDVAIVNPGKVIRPPVNEEELSWYWYAYSIAMRLDPADPYGEARIPINGGQSIGDIAVDRNGDVYGAGLYNTSTDPSDGGDPLSNDPITLKYNIDGKPKGVIALVGGNLGGVNVNESGTCVAIDFTVDTNDPNRGGVCFSYDIFIERIDYNYDTCVMKMTHDGVKKWSRRITVPADENREILSWGLCTDSQGNVVVAGLMNIWQVVSPWNFSVVQAFICSFAYDGTLKWIKHLGFETMGAQVDGSGTLNGLQASMGYEVCSDYENSVILAGNMVTDYSDGDGGVLSPSGMLVKFSEQGVVQWKRGLLGHFIRNDGSDYPYAYSSVTYNLQHMGISINGCATDSAGDIYCSSWASIALSSSTGYHHFHVFKVSAAGGLVWLRVIEIPYYTTVGANMVRTRLSLGPSGVYVTFPRPSNPSTSEDQGAYLFKFQKSDIENGVQGGDLIWQRLIEFKPNPSTSLFTEYSGIFVYSIEANNRGDIYLGGEIMNIASTFMAKLPGSGGFIGQKRDLLFTDPGLIVYSNQGDIPVRENPGPGGGIIPGYEFELRSDFEMNVQTGALETAVVDHEQYLPMYWSRTDKILKKYSMRQNV